MDRVWALPALAWLVLFACANASVPPPPNVVLILADDLGWGDVGFHQGPIPTPGIDRLAREGVELATLLVTPLCSPTRAALLTGRNPVRLGFGGQTISPVGRASLLPEEVTLAEAFRAAGYATAVFGKWHLGGAPTPLEQGFEEFCGTLHGAADYFTRELGPRPAAAGFDARRRRHPPGLVWECAGEPLRESGYTTDLLRDRALEYIRRQGDRPFFLYLPFTAPHSPPQAPPEYLARVPAAITSEEERVHAAMIVALDDAVAAIVRELDRQRLAERTLVVFLSDNGGDREASNRPFRGEKSSLYEGGVRIPAIVRWPGRLAAGSRVEAMLAVEDLAPTVLALAGVSRPAGPPVDGLDVSGLLAPDAARREVRQDYVWIERGSDGIRTPRWKLIRRVDSRELFDLDADPGERRDLFATNPRVAAELEARLDEWQASVPAYPTHVAGREKPLPRPQGKVIEIRLRRDAPAGAEPVSVSVGLPRGEQDRTLVTSPGDRLEYDLLIAEGRADGFFVDKGFNSTIPWAPFLGVPAVDQHGTPQSFAAGFPQAVGRWARRVVGLANFAPSPIGLIRIALTGSNRGQRIYLDNPGVRRANGEVIELYREGELKFRVRPETAAGRVEVREVSLADVAVP